MIKSKKVERIGIKENTELVEKIKKVEKAGKLKEKIDKLTKELNEIKNQLNEMLDVGESIASKKYKVSKIKKVSVVYNTEAIGKKLTKKELLEVANLSVTKLRKILPEKELSKYEEETKISTELRIKKGE